MAGSTSVALLTGPRQASPVIAIETTSVIGISSGDKDMERLKTWTLTVWANTNPNPTPSRPPKPPQKQAFS